MAASPIVTPGMQISPRGTSSSSSPSSFGDLAELSPIVASPAVGSVTEPPPVAPPPPPPPPALESMSAPQLSDVAIAGLESVGLFSEATPFFQPPLSPNAASAPPPPCCLLAPPLPPPTSAIGALDGCWGASAPSLSPRGEPVVAASPRSSGDGRLPLLSGAPPCPGGTSPSGVPLFDRGASMYPTPG